MPSNAYLSLDPVSLSTPEVHQYLLSTVAPRPIALASTVDAQGKVNLSPFSFFNVFSANPPILIFSPARRGRDNTTKHTFENVQEVKEVCINIVNYAIVQQMSLSSTEYDKGVNEFVKAGFTPLKSDKIQPPRVAESPASFECKVNQIIELGQEGGAGNLIICEVVRMHFNTIILKENNMPDTFALDLVSRMGEEFYCRATKQAIFEVPKPGRVNGIGFDALPHHLLQSTVLSGNDLAQLASYDHVPTPAETTNARAELAMFETSDPYHWHRKIQQYIHCGQIENAINLAFVRI